MSTKRTVFLLAAALALGACGSSGGTGGVTGTGGGSGGNLTGSNGSSGGGTNVSNEAAREFTSDLSDARRLLDIHDGLAPTAPDMLPGGRAYFDGQVAMVFGNAPATFEAADLLGDVDLEADFASGRIIGWLDDFNTRDGQRIRGDLDLRNGQIAGNAFTADFDGRLSGAPAAPGNVSGAIEGTFLGAGASGVSGTGTASTADGAATLVFEAAREFD
jgi:hypothetical protein